VDVLVNFASVTEPAFVVTRPMVAGTFGAFTWNGEAESVVKPAPDVMVTLPAAFVPLAKVSALLSVRVTPDGLEVRTTLLKSLPAKFNETLVAALSVVFPVAVIAVKAFWPMDPVVDSKETFGAVIEGTERAPPDTIVTVPVPTIEFVTATWPAVAVRVSAELATTELRGASAVKVTTGGAPAVVFT